MKKIIILIVITVCGVVLTAQIVSADNPPGKIREVSLFSNVKARNIGDPLSVIISESSSATRNTNTSTKKQSKAGLKGNETTGALDGLFPGVGGSMDLSNQYDGEGSTIRNGTFSSRLTVKVVDVLPNGNLLIEGTKTTEINEETEVITLSGIVQPLDISPTNTIYSYQIANAKLTYKGKGSLSQAHRPGFLIRIINWLL